MDMVAVGDALGGLVLALLGVWLAANPRAWANFGEQMDAVGSTRDGTEVEAADWNVSLTKYTGVAFALAGSVAVVLAIL